MSWLSYSITLCLLKSSFSIKMQRLLWRFEGSCIQKEATNNCSSSSFSMITVKNCNSLRIFFEEIRNLKAYLKKKFEIRTSMILPKVAFNIFEFFLINLSSTKIDSNVFIIMIFREELTHRVNRITIEFLNSWCRESHSYDSISNICEIKIEAIFFISIFRSPYNLSKKIHVVVLSLYKFMMK